MHATIVIIAVSLLYQ